MENKTDIKKETTVENQDAVNKEEPVPGARKDVAAEPAASVHVDKEKVDKLIRGSVYASMGIGIAPLPFVNVAVVTANNINMVRKLSSMYGVEFKEGAAKKIIAAVTGAGVGVLATPFISSAVFGLPLVGLPLAVGTMSAMNGMTTCSLGRMFVTHFERGGKFIGANVDSMKEDFSDAYQNSREWLGSTISGTKAAQAESR